MADWALMDHLRCFSRIGVQSLSVYPWHSDYDANGNFAEDDKCSLYGIQGFKISAHSIDSDKGKIPEYILRFSVCKTSLDVFSAVMGGSFAAFTDEEHYQNFTAYSEPLPFFSVKAHSTNGDGAMKLVIPSLQVLAVRYNLDRDMVGRFIVNAKVCEPLAENKALFRLTNKRDCFEEFK